MESLLHLNETDMARLFSTAPTHNFLLDPEMSVLDLVMKVKPIFRDSKYNYSDCNKQGRPRSDAKE